MLMLAAMLSGDAQPARAQPAEKLGIVLEVRSEGRASRDEFATRLLVDVRRGLEAIGDVEVVPRDRSRRIIWIVAGTTAGSFAASVMITALHSRGLHPTLAPLARSAPKRGSFGPIAFSPCGRRCPKGG